MEKNLLKLFIFILFVQGVVFAAPAGIISSKQGDKIATQDLIDENIEIAEKNIKESKVLLEKIKEMHEEIKYLLERGEESTLNMRVDVINDDIYDLNIELDNENNLTKKTEIREAISTLNQINNEIKDSFNEKNNN